MVSAPNRLSVLRYTDIDRLGTLHTIGCTYVHIYVWYMIYVVYVTPSSRAMAQYFRKTFEGGVKRETYAGAQVTSVVTVVRDEYRYQTAARMKRVVGTAKSLHGADLDKLINFAQDLVARALLVNHIKHRTKAESGKDEKRCGVTLRLCEYARTT